MKTIYKNTESIFEKFTSIALKVFGSSITFIIAVIMVIVYFISKPFYKQSYHETIYDIILCFTFLGFFIIQKSFNKFNTALNLKMNELVSSHDKASNRLVNIENKSEAELVELSKHYSEIAAASQKTGELQTTQSIEHIIGNKKDESGKNEK